MGQRRLMKKLTGWQRQSRASYRNTATAIVRSKSSLYDLQNEASALLTRALLAGKERNFKLHDSLMKKFSRLHSEMRSRSWEIQDRDYRTILHSASSRDKFEMIGRKVV